MINPNIAKGDPMKVKNVIVETLHPNGLALNSNLSPFCGQTLKSYSGARIGIKAVLGTHEDDFDVRQSVDLQMFDDGDGTYSIAPAAWSFSHA